MSRQEQIAKSVLMLAATFGVEADETTLEAYRIGLSELTDDEIKLAVAMAIKRCTFFPKPCELIEFAKTQGVGYESQAIIAWEQVNEALRQGSSKSLSPLSRAIVNHMGGFDTLMNAPLSDLGTWKRKSFIESYSTLMRESPDRVAALAGPQSEIGKSIAAGFKRVASREGLEAIEQRNRQRLQDLSVATNPTTY